MAIRLLFLAPYLKYVILINANVRFYRYEIIKLCLSVDNVKKGNSCDKCV